MDAYMPCDCRREKDRESVEGFWRADSSGQAPKAAQPRLPIAKRNAAECGFTPLADNSASIARPAAGGKWIALSAISLGGSRGDSII